MKPGLQRLNELSVLDAEAALLACGGAARWARAMSGKRPYRTESDLFEAADEIWRALGREDWLEAFARHPQIGQKIVTEEGTRNGSKPLGAAVRWSLQEQTTAKQSPENLKRRLAEANREYRERFGYIFIVCASGKTAAQILALLEGRLNNDPSVELCVAAKEQHEIMHLRLRKLISEPAS
jgi:2-oxo-4-hydroxy-4-carboxy-5-ureidoimidazoline decarboxylase